MTAPAARRVAAGSGGGVVADDAHAPTVDPAIVRALGLAAGVAAAGLALTSTGSALIAAVLLGLAARSRWATTACLLAVAAVAVRWATVSLDDLAGIQTVLGPAVRVGPATAAASAWAAGAAVVLGARVPDGAGAAERVVVTLAAGALGAALAVGPGLDGEVWLRVVATGAATVAGLGAAEIERRRTTARRGPGAWRVRLAVLAGVVAVVLAGWPT